MADCNRENSTGRRKVAKMPVKIDGTPCPKTCCRHNPRKWKVRCSGQLSRQRKCIMNKEISLKENLRALLTIASFANLKSFPY